MNTLNPHQQQAIKSIEGPLLVLAGAGSGKTRVITEKIAYLIQTQSFKPQHIVAVTFTNKAAQEMKTRINSYLAKQDHQALTIATFHSLGLKMIRHHHSELGLRSHFSILDTEDGKSLLTQIMQNENMLINSPVDLLVQTISTWKNALCSPQEVLNSAQDEHQAACAKLYKHYNRYLKAYNAVDFDDMLYLPVCLLKNQTDLCTYWQNNIRYLLVDEYQDTNATQYQLIKLLTGVRQQFTVVGDDDQAIYAWRGAQAENLSQLQTDYPNLKVIKLERNYRSTQNILQSANQLISHNPHLFTKTLYSHHREGELVKIRVTRDGEEEAKYVAQTIMQQHLKKRIPYSDFAILYRGNYQAQLFEQALVEYQIPYYLTGGTSFFNRSEIKDIMAYFRLFINPNDDAAFLRIINTPRRGIGPNTLEKLNLYAKKRNIQLLPACSEIGLSELMTGPILSKLRTFSEWITTQGDLAMQGDTMTVLKQVVETIEYSNWVYQQCDNPKTAEKRLHNIELLLTWISQALENQSEDGFAEIISKMCLRDNIHQTTEHNQTNEVQLSTLHSAKGLEFKHVFLVGMEEARLPHQNSIDQNTIEEERRLAYVGMTRAMETLTLTLAKQRKRYQDIYACTPSRFLHELPEQLLVWEGQLETKPYTAEENQKLGERQLQHLHQLLGGETE